MRPAGQGTKQDSHFNVRPVDKPRTGNVEGTRDHCPFR
ncbi:HNH/endonuclease VII fold putative polymorphic toxin [Actinopolyspora erythraea]